MPRRCTVCAHEERNAIDVALVRGASYREIARQWGVSKDAAARHQAEHLPAALAAAGEASERLRADGLLGELRALARRAEVIAQRAEEAGDLKTALRGIRELTRIVELQAKLVGQVRDGTTVNVLVAEEWTSIRSSVLAALGPFPEARLAVSRALSAEAPRV